MAAAAVAAAAVAMDVVVEEQQQPAQPSLADLPEAILLATMRLLDGAELAKLLVQDRRLRHLGSEQELWKVLCLTRWPTATADHHNGDWRQLFRHRAALPPAFVSCVDRCHAMTTRAAGGGAGLSAAIAGGPAPVLRVNGASLPALPSPAGSPAGSPVKPNVYGLPAVRPFASIPGMVLEAAMQMLFSLCCLCGDSGGQHQQKQKQALPAQRTLVFGGGGNAGASSGGNGSCCSCGSGGLARAASSGSCSSSGGSATSSGSSEAAAAAGFASELALVRRDMAWWLASKPEAVLGFARRTGDLLGEWDMWGSGFSSWQEVLWRRSALQFLVDLRLGPEAGVCPSVTGRLARELERLDGLVRGVDTEAAWLGVRPPAGLPAAHWWYRLQGRMS